MNHMLAKASASLVDLRDAWMFSDSAWFGPRGWPVKSVHHNRRMNPFFVVGHPRSGTTLLRAILCRHPELFIPPENGNLWRMIRAFGGLRGQSWEMVVDAVLQAFSEGYEFERWGIEIDTLRKLALALPRERRDLASLISLVYLQYGNTHAAGKQIWGDKTTPGSFDYLGKLSRVFPAAAYIHIVRDGRDCVASCVKAGFYERNYSVAATAWRDNVRACRRFGSRIADAGRYLEIRYEDLVADPERQIPTLCEFLGLSIDRAMFQHSQGIGQELPDVGSISHHQSVSRPIFTGSVGKWKREIPGIEQAVVLKIVQSELERCGYS